MALQLIIVILCLLLHAKILLYSISSLFWQLVWAYKQKLFLSSYRTRLFSDQRLDDVSVVQQSYFKDLLKKTWNHSLIIAVKSKKSMDFIPNATLTSILLQFYHLSNPWGQKLFHIWRKVWFVLLKTWFLYRSVNV